MSQEEIEALMNGADFDETEDESSEETEIDEDSIDVDDVLAGIDGIVEDEPEESKEIETADTTYESDETDDVVSEDDHRKNNNQYPLPASDENKVVNQLNEVADDSEAKASQIFDALSFILDENAEIAQYNKKMSEFIVQQSELLESLSKKFPNVTVFDENLTSANELIEISKDLDSKLNGENNKVFETMELMQYHDINRQKIERVMAVIKKLSSYLNGIFEDDSTRAEVQIAKHIAGDSNEVVTGDDIESLITEFSEK